MPAAPALHIAPEVAALLTPAMLVEVNAAHILAAFGCFTCRQTGAATPANPASLVVLHTPTESIFCYAHARCAPSQIVDFSDLPHAKPEKINVVTGLWLRTQHDDLRAMLIMFPTSLILASVGRHDVTERLSGQFAAGGFALLGGLDDELPHVEDVHVELDNEHLHLGYAHRDGPELVTTMARDAIAANWPDWLQAATEDGQIGVVVATGTNAGPNSEPIPALQRAISAGRAMGAAATLHQQHQCRHTTGRAA